MSKQSLLLVDGDTRSLRVLEVSLRKAGFSVTPAVSVGDALDKLEVNAPDLIISETKFSTELDGFELRRRLRATQAWADIPFIFLTAETAIENKIKGLELGVDDYLTKPIYIKEIITRINILLQKKQRQFLDAKKDGTRFAGRVSDMPVVDVIQTIEVSRKSGVIQFGGGPNRQATIYFRDGKVIDAEAGTLQGEDAVYRLLTWNDGEFEVEFRTVRRREVIATSSQGLLMEGMRRLDEWSRLLEQLPPLSHRFEIDAAELITRLGEVPDENNRILRLFDSKRTLIEVIDASDFGDLECLQAISRLYFEGMLIDLDQGAVERPKRDTGKPWSMVHEGAPNASTLHAVASGPIDLTTLEHRAAAAEIPVPLPIGQSGPVLAAIEAQPSVPVRIQMPVESGPVQAPQPTTKPGSVTMGWDAVEPPADEAAPAPQAAPPPATPAQPTTKPGSVTMGWDAVAAPDELPAPRESGEIIADEEVLEEEPIRGPLLGGYRPSSLRLIDEAVAAAQLIEPSLFSDEELAAAGVTRPSAEQPAASAPSTDKPIARVQLTQRTAEPRLDNARDLVEVTPSTSTEHPPNGRSAKPATMPPPVPGSAARLQKEIDDAPLLESDLMTSGEIRVPTDDEIANAPVLDLDPETSGEFKPVPPVRARKLPTTPPPIPGTSTIVVAPTGTAVMTAVMPPPDVKVDDDGVPTAISPEEESGEIADEGPTDPSRRRQRTAPIADEAVRMIGSHGKDRADAAGELRPISPKGAEAEKEREVVTIMPRRITREVPLVAAGEAKAGEAEAKAGEGKPAVESPNRPPPKRVSVAGGVVKAPSGPGKVAAVLFTATSVLIGATVFSYCHKSNPKHPVVAVREDAAVVTPPPPEDAEQYAGFGMDAAPMIVDKPDAALVVQHKPDAQLAAPPDAAVVAQRPDAAPRPDAAQVVQTPPDASQVALTRPDAAQVAVSTADATVDKSKEAKALYDKGHTALEDGDPDTALQLLDKSLALKKSAKVFLEKARALQRLQKIDEALAAVDEAIKMSSEYAPAYEQKGTMLWSAQRYNEARPVLEHYLELEPTGAKADKIRSMLEENK